MNNIDISNFATDSLQIVKSSDFLPHEDWKAISSMKNELQDSFEKKQIWRTETEMNISVLNDTKFPTNAAKYWQCVREQSVFFDNLVALSFDYRRNLVKIERIKRKLDITKDVLDKEELMIDLEEANFAKKSHELAAKDRVRELKMWSKKKEELDNGSFDKKDVNTHQLISYTKRFINQFIASGNNGSPSERANLEGQLVTSLKSCYKKGILKSVTKDLPSDSQELVKSITNQLLSLTEVKSGVTLKEETIEIEENIL